MSSADIAPPGLIRDLTDRVSSPYDDRAGWLGRLIWISISLCAVGIAATQPLAAFTVDEFFYLQMADAMAHEGRLSFQQVKIDGGEAVPMGFAFPLAEAGPDDAGRLVPQYPSGYALIAAPFMALFGPRGLIWLNLVAFFGSIVLVRLIAQQFALSRAHASATAMIFALASYAGGYAFAIWPHCLTLVFVLGAVWAGLRGANSERPEIFIAVSGLVSGIALSVRVDAVVTIFALALWLRLFAGVNRKTIAIFVVSLIPGIVLAALLNDIKFGEFHPLTYGKVGEGNDFRAYAPLFALLVVGYGLLLSLNLNWLRAQARKLFVQMKSVLSGRLAIAFGSVLAFVTAALIVSGASETLGTLIHGVLALLFDLQIHPDEVGHCAIKPDAGGIYTFCGLYKRTVLQSMPFVGLALMGIGLIWYGSTHERRTSALLWLVAGGYVALYAINAWHGGLAMSMRYLLPVAACLTILAVKSGLPLLAQSGLSHRTQILALVIGIGAALSLPHLVATDLKGIVHLYPPLLVGTVVVLLAGGYLIWPGPALRRSLLLTSIAAVGMGGANTAGDIVLERNIRGAFADREARFANAVRPDSLVIAGSPARYGRLALGELSVIYPLIGSEAAVMANVKVFREAERDVYVDGETAAAQMRALGQRLVPVSEAQSLWKTDRED